MEIGEVFCAVSFSFAPLSFLLLLLLLMMMMGMLQLIQVVGFLHLPLYLVSSFHPQSFAPFLLLARLMAPLVGRLVSFDVVKMGSAVLLLLLRSRPTPILFRSFLLLEVLLPSPRLLLFSSYLFVLLDSDVVCRSREL